MRTRDRLLSTRSRVLTAPKKHRKVAILRHLGGSGEDPRPAIQYTVAGPSTAPLLISSEWPLLVILGGSGEDPRPSPVLCTVAGPHRSLTHGTTTAYYPGTHHLVASFLTPPAPAMPGLHYRNATSFASSKPRCLRKRKHSRF